MSKIAIALALIVSILSGIASAYAEPQHGNATRDLARMGHITPHGVWDGF